MDRGKRRATWWRSQGSVHGVLKGGSVQEFIRRGRSSQKVSHKEESTNLEQGEGTKPCRKVEAWWEPNSGLKFSEDCSEEMVRWRCIQPWRESRKWRRGRISCNREGVWLGGSHESRAGSSHRDHLVEMILRGHPGVQEGLVEIGMHHGGLVEALRMTGIMTIWWKLGGGGFKHAAVRMGMEQDHVADEGSDQCGADMKTRWWSSCGFGEGISQRVHLVGMNVVSPSNAGQVIGMEIRRGRSMEVEF